MEFMSLGLTEHNGQEVVNFINTQKDMLLVLLLLNSHERSRKHSSFAAKCVDLVSSLVTVDR